MRRAGLLAAAVLAMASLGRAEAQANAPPGAASSPVPLATVTPAPAAPIPRGLVIPPVPSVGAGYRAPALAEPSGTIVGVAQQPFVGIALQDAVALALLRNSDLAVSASNRRIAAYRIVAAQGASDVRFSVQPLYQFMKQAPLSSFAAGPGGGPITQTTLGASGAFSGQTTNGTQYSLGYSAQGFRSDNTANGFNPYYESALSFALTQPLLRGRFTDTRRQLELARINADSTADTTLLTASNTVANLADTYWDLVAAWRNVAIQEEALREAKAQSVSNARLVRRGAAAPVDVVESDTQVDVYQDNVLSALENVARLQNQLKVAMLADPADPIWTANLVPTSPALDLPRAPSLEDVLLSALRDRPEVAQLAEQRRTSDVQLAYARDQAKPQVDVNVAYTSNGFAGYPQSLLANPIFGVFGPVFSSVEQLIAYADAHGAAIPPLRVAFPRASPTFTGGFGTALGNLFANRLPEVAVSVTVGVPLRNRTARANLAAAQEQQQQLAIQQAALIQRLAFEARNALSTLAAARSRLIAARAAREAAERVYASEQRKFRAGTSTTFLVLQRQTAVATQRGRELQAQTDLNKAVVDVQRVSGSILARNGFDLRSAGSAPVPTTALPSPAPQPLPELSPLPRP